MAAQDFGVVTIVIPDAPFDRSTVGPQLLNSSLGFILNGGDFIQTLSPNNPNNANSIQGLLYYPTLPPNSPCDNVTRALIPPNVTTIANLPNLPLVALAPWTEPDCVLAYLAVMRSDQVRGAIMFQPGTARDQPPPVNNPIWSLQDGGKWKSQYDFPVYAIPGAMGASLLYESSQYSGNLSNAPHAQELSAQYDPHDSARLFVRIDTNSSNGIPSLWVFLIIVLAILLGLVVTTSVFMHWLQRRQRAALQRRVARGEVDLEALGIKRLQVPQELLDKMPQYAYTSKPERDSGTGSSTDKSIDVNVSQAEKSESSKNGDKVTTAPVKAREVAFTQPTCPICLEDFVHEETTIRELPCNHIFHPECIDPFLRENSSLCPMCKKSALPPGYCPIQVTNLMVRRERLMRRTQRRGTPSSATGSTPYPGFHEYSLPRPIMALANRRTRPDPVTSPEIPLQDAPQQEQGAAPGRRQTVVEDVPLEVQAQGSSARRAWLRERLVHQQVRHYEQRADEGRAAEQARPLWRRMAGRVFPSL